MSNLLDGHLAVYAQQSLDQITDQTPLFDLFMTNIKTDTTGGGSLTTRLPTSTTTFHNSSTGFTNQNASSSAVVLTYKQADVFHRFTELEWSNMDPSVAATIWLPNAISTITSGIAKEAIALVVSSSYSNYVVSSVAGFSGSAAINLAEKMSTANIPLPSRNLIVKPTAYASLVSSLNATSTYGSDSIIKNYRFLKGVFGFENVVEYAGLPDNSENLIGIGCNPQGLCYSFREPLAPPQNMNGISKTAIDGKTGISVQVRNWYDNAGYVWFGATVQYAVTIGNPAMLYRIVTS